MSLHLKETYKWLSEEQEKSSSVASPALHGLIAPLSRRILRLNRYIVKVDLGDRGSEEPGYGCPLQDQDQGEEEPHELEQEQDVAVDVMRGAKGEEKDDSNDDNGKCGEKQRHQDEAEEISSGIHRSKTRNDSHDANGEDDEDPQPAKRRKLRPVSTQNPTLSLDHSPMWRLRPFRSRTPSSTTQSDDAQCHANRRRLQTPVDDQQNHTPRSFSKPVRYDRDYTNRQVSGTAYS